MATFCNKVTYNFRIKVDSKALFAGEDPSFTLNTNDYFQTDSLIFFLKCTVPVILLRGHR